MHLQMVQSEGLHPQTWVICHEFWRFGGLELDSSVDKAELPLTKHLASYMYKCLHVTFCSWLSKNLKMLTFLF